MQQKQTDRSAARIYPGVRRKRAGDAGAGTADADPQEGGTLKILILGVASEIRGTGRAIAERHGVTRLHPRWVLENNRPVNRLITSWAPDALKAVHRVWRYDPAETQAVETACESRQARSEHPRQNPNPCPEPRQLPRNHLRG